MQKKGKKTSRQLVLVVLAPSAIAKEEKNKQTMMNSLICGGLAGVAVDIALFPLDTIKTRIQSRQGFLKSGGFKGLYTGLGPMAFASFPGAASFFVTYDSIKNSSLLMHSNTSNNNNNSLSFMAIRNQVVAATGGELVACLIRVPSENVKQNLQALNYKTLREALIGINKRERYGFYKGYFATILREIPFSIIQFPLWEGGKKLIVERKGSCSPFESALCGSAAGGFAGAVTTPLDVIKTRLMTSPDKYSGIVNTIRIIQREEGNATFLRGLKPRVTWISIGGFVFFGAYEEFKKIFHWFFVVV